MENKDVNITFQLNTNIIIISLVVCFLLSVLIFCACYNLPIIKKIRGIMKRELISTHVDEAFTMPTLKDFKSAPNAFIEDVKDVLCNKDEKKKEEEEKPKHTYSKKPVVEGFFTNMKPN